MVSVIIYLLCAARYDVCGAVRRLIHIRSSPFTDVFGGCVWRECVCVPSSCWCNLRKYHVQFTLRYLRHFTHDCKLKWILMRSSNRRQTTQSINPSYLRRIVVAVPLRHPAQPNLGKHYTRLECVHWLVNAMLYAFAYTHPQTHGVMWMFTCHSIRIYWYLSSNFHIVTPPHQNIIQWMCTACTAHKLYSPIGGASRSRIEIQFMRKHKCEHDSRPPDRCNDVEIVLWVRLTKIWRMSAHRRRRRLGQATRVSCASRCIIVKTISATDLFCVSDTFRRSSA